MTLCGKVLLVKEWEGNKLLIHICKKLLETFILPLPYAQASWATRTPRNAEISHYWRNRAATTPQSTIFQSAARCSARRLE